MSFNIAIDGPAGAGKSTIARLVAKKLSFIYVDTGAMYRAVAIYLLKNKVASDDAQGLKEACKHIQVTIEYVGGEQQVILNGENVTGQLRTEEAGQMASASSANADVRAALLDLQRNLARTENVLMDGRDIGSNVLPEAQMKIYLTADAKIRAKRRCLELQEKGIWCEPDTIEKEIIERDTRDMNRSIAPLIQAKDAVRIDTTDMTIDEVVEQIVLLYQEVKAQ